MAESVIFVEGADNKSPLLCDKHREIFDIHQLMQAGRKPSLTSNRWMGYFVMRHPACEAPIRKFIVMSELERSYTRQLKGESV